MITTKNGVMSAANPTLDAYYFVASKTVLVT